ncbi:major virion DNA-binding protein [Trichoplusia ni ascovirus 6b]|nr:major virion DNA-binding protein [Trichoplusia ni ascovirus 6b]
MPQATTPRRRRNAQNMNNSAERVTRTQCEDFISSLQKKNPITNRKIDVFGSTAASLRRNCSMKHNYEFTAPRRSKANMKCTEFLSNPRENPITGRKLAANKPTYKKFVKVCGSPGRISPSPRRRATQSRSPSPRRRVTQTRSPSPRRRATQSRSPSPRRRVTQTRSPSPSRRRRSRSRSNSVEFSTNCTKFINNDKINPKTNKNIKYKGPTYKKIVTKCKQNLNESPKLPQQMCNEFHQNAKKKNPITGRKIAVGSVVQRRIVSQCGGGFRSPSRSRSRSASRRRSPSPARSRSRSASRRRSPSPARSRSRSPSPAKSRSRSTSRRSASPARSKSRSQTRSRSRSTSRRSASPARSKSRSQTKSRSRSPSPARSRSRSTSRRSASPARSKSRSQTRSRSRSPSPARSKSRSQTRSRSRSASKRRSASPARSKSRSQTRSSTRSPSPARSKSRSQTRSRSRSPSSSSSSSRSRSTSSSRFRSLEQKSLPELRKYAIDLKLSTMGHVYSLDKYSLLRLIKSKEGSTVSKSSSRSRSSCSSASSKTNCVTGGRRGITDYYSMTVDQLRSLASAKKLGTEEILRNLNAQALRVLLTSKTPIRLTPQSPNRTFRLQTPQPGTSSTDPLVSKNFGVFKQNRRLL